ncbi:MAG TPA: sugar phosphate isomerase/epimerase family protein [bacterium]|uniref:Inosose dehydratase n=1 Tax=candidate division TA06 bacterium ADurb.Bin417 TaxID=1852828 RepID=A0A1V5MKL3_UNCT6|nr:MAG: Inosose dehydratase [candidate division TA06 bacterium ADurb.Bin417]HNQ35953.1 sugar phosphate isomerase/epimerase family protein [bacterium]
MYVAIRDGILKSAGYESIRSGLDDLKLANLELEFFRDYSVYRPDAWEKQTFAPEAAAGAIRDLFGPAGVRVSAFLLHNNFNSADPDAEVRWVIDVIKTAQALSVPAIRIDAVTKGEKEESFEVRVNRFVECMKAVLAAAPAAGVQLGIENHGIQGNDPEFLRQVIGRVGDPRLGITLDTGNFYWSGLPLSEVYRVFEEMAGQVKHTHVKNIRFPEEIRERRREPGLDYKIYVSPIGEGDIDHSRLVRILARAGYAGPLTIEDESLGKFELPARREVLKRDVAHLAGLL